MTDESTINRTLNDPTSLLAVANLPGENDPFNADRLRLCGDQFLEVFQNTGNDEDIAQAIKAYEQGAASLSEGDPRLGRFLRCISVGCWERYERFGLLEDLEKSITTGKRVVAVTAEEDVSAGQHNNLGIFLSQRFERTGDLQDISEAIQHQQRGVELTPDGHVTLPALLNNLGNSIQCRFKHTGDMQDISEAIRRQQHAVQLTPDGHADLPGRLNNLGNSFLCRFDHTGDMQDISEAMRHHQHAVQLTPHGHADLPTWLTNLGISFLRRFERTGDMEDLSGAIRHQRRAVQSSPDGHADLPALYNNLGNSLLSHFKRAGDMEGISEAIRHQQHAVQLTRDGHTDLPGRLNNLGTSLSCRFKRTGKLQDISGAILHQQRAIELTPDGHADLPVWFNNLGVSYMHRFERTGDMDDLFGAIRHQRRAVQSSPDGHADLPAWFNSLGNSLLRHFEHTGDMQSISEAIQLQQHAVQLTPDGHAFLPALHSSLGNTFQCRFKHTGDMEDLSGAIQHQQRAVKLTPDRHADLPGRLNNLGTSFSCCFKRTGNMQDISEAIQHQQLAVQLTPEGHANLPAQLNNLGNSFLDCFKHTGDIQYILEAIQHQQHAVQLIQDGHADLPGWLNNLGNSFSYRFEHTGDRQDLLEAIQYQQRAVQLTPDEHVDLPAWLSNLGNSFQYHFKCTGDMQDISEAIRYQQRAVQLTQTGHAHLPDRLNNLGNSLSYRFDHTGDIQDISEAIRHQQIAVQLTPGGHADLPAQLNNLGASFLYRFKRTGKMQEFSEAIQHQQHALRLIPDGHADLPGHLYNLGNSFLSCIELEPTGTYYECLSHALLSFRLSATFPTAHACIIQLLSVISGIENTVQRRHEVLVDTSQLSLAASAAALSLGCPDKALEWLVEGRCIVWNQINQLRTALDELYSHDPGLAECLSVLSKDLEIAGFRTDSHSKPAGLSMHNKIILESNHIKLAREWEKLLDTIRNIPQFKDFLQPRRCADIMSGLSEEGPIVVVNIHSKRCDALALIAGAAEPLHIPLPNFSHQEAKCLAIGLRSYLLSIGSRAGRPSKSHSPPPDVDFPVVLKVLWSNVVSPILDALAFSAHHSDAKLPRIWWCPTGPLAFLPIHAAGIYDKGKAIPGKCLSEFAVSSYIPTINVRDSEVASIKNCHDANAPTGLLMISQPNTPGQLEIPGTRDEIAKIEKQLGIQEIPSCTLDDKNATVKHVLESMDMFPCIHFACHASQHAETPLKSAIHLHDGPLELSEIMKKNLRHSDFAFLSACQTSQGDESLPEEVVHLASGMLAAGYRSVVGTMWSVLDKHGPDLAEFFYKNLLEDKKEPKIDSSQAARALHAATQQLREKLYANSESPSTFLAWVPYIHIGM